MKRITRHIALLLSAAAFALVSCDSDMTKIEASHTPAIDKGTIVPMPNESGSIRAYVGTEVSAAGFNLELVSRVTIGDADAEITERTIKTLKFKIPALDLVQKDAPHFLELKVYDADGESVIFRHPYYVTIPVTDALVTGYSPAEGTVGTEITVAGRNLMQITRVKFGTTNVEAAAFTAQTADAVKFAVPAGGYAAGDSQHAISAEWGTETIDVSGEALFTLHIPKFNSPTQSGTSVIGDEIVLTGENLNLITSVKWGDSELTITASSATSLTVKFPSSIQLASPAVQSKAVTAVYGTPEQSVTVHSGWSLDTTPLSTVTIPVVTSLTAADGYYLGNTVVIAGEELTAVDRVELWYTDGGEKKIPAAISAGTTDARLEFTVPDGVTFSTATDVTLKLIYNGTDDLTAGTAKIYPFYCAKGLKMSTGSSSKASYPAENQNNAFLLLNECRVISVDEWWDDSIDPFAKASTPIVNAAGTVAAGTSAADYYSVAPYLFFSAGSDHKLALNSPANSASQLKTHFYGASLTVLPSVYGSPVFYFRVMNDAGDVGLKASIIDGTVESIVNYTRLGGAAAPALAQPPAVESTSAWVEGSVVVLQYINAAACTGKQGKPAATTDIYKQGFMYIKDITNADLGTGKAREDRVGYIEFDLYWSKEMNK